MPLASKPSSAYRPLARQPAQWTRHPPAIARPPLWEFVFLSMLLHALFITLFGAPSGGSREGRALWGSLQVVLQGAEPESAPMLKIDRGAALERLRAATKPRPAPSAPVKREPRVEPVAPPIEAPRAQPAPVEVPFSMPQLLDRLATPQRKLEIPKFQVPPPTPVQTARPAAPVTPAPIPTPSEAPAAEQPAARVERVPAEEPLIPAPLLQPLPAPPALERLASPPIERPPVETPIVPAMPSTPPVERAAVEVPALPAPSLESVAPPRVEPASKPAEKAPVQETPVLPKLPPAMERAEPPVAEREAPAKIEREPPTVAEPALRTSPLPSPAPSTSVMRPGQDAPFTTYDPTAPGIDLDAVRKRAAALARQGTGNRAALPFPMPPLPERKTKEQIAIEKARKPDCKTAYQNLGLAAVIPLIANEFGEGNCKW
jgi:hypothetical protein